MIIEGYVYLRFRLAKVEDNNRDLLQETGAVSQGVVLPKIKAELPKLGDEIQTKFNDRVKEELNWYRDQVYKIVREEREQGGHSELKPDLDLKSPLSGQAGILAKTLNNIWSERLDAIRKEFPTLLIDERRLEELLDGARKEGLEQEYNKFSFDKGTSYKERMDQLSKIPEIALRRDEYRRELFSKEFLDTTNKLMEASTMVGVYTSLSNSDDHESVTKHKGFREERARLKLVFERLVADIPENYPNRDKIVAGIPNLNTELASYELAGMKRFNELTQEKQQEALAEYEKKRKEGGALFAVKEIFDRAGTGKEHFKEWLSLVTVGTGETVLGLIYDGTHARGAKYIEDERKYLNSTKEAGSMWGSDEEFSKMGNYSLAVEVSALGGLRHVSDAVLQPGLELVNVGRIQLQRGAGSLGSLGVDAYTGDTTNTLSYTEYQEAEKTDVGLKIAKKSFEVGEIAASLALGKADTAGKLIGQLTMSGGMGAGSALSSQLMEMDDPKKNFDVGRFVDESVSNTAGSAVFSGFMRGLKGNSKFLTSVVNKVEVVDGGADFGSAVGNFDNVKGEYSLAGALGGLAIATTDVADISVGDKIGEKVDGYLASKKSISSLDLESKVSAVDIRTKEDILKTPAVREEGKLENKSEKKVELASTDVEFEFRQSHRVVNTLSRSQIPTEYMLVEGREYEGYRSGNGKVFYVVKESEIPDLYSTILRSRGEIDPNGSNDVNSFIDKRTGLIFTRMPSPNESEAVTESRVANLAHENQHRIDLEAGRKIDEERAYKVSSKFTDDETLTTYDESRYRETKNLSLAASRDGSNRDRPQGSEALNRYVDWLAELDFGDEIVVGKKGKYFKSPTAGNIESEHLAVKRISNGAIGSQYEVKNLSKIPLLIKNPGGNELLNQGESGIINYLSEVHVVNRKGVSLNELIFRREIKRPKARSDSFNYLKHFKESEIVRVNNTIDYLSANLGDIGVGEITSLREGMSAKVSAETSETGVFVARYAENGKAKYILASSDNNSHCSAVSMLTLDTLQQDKQEGGTIGWLWQALMPFSASKNNQSELFNGLLSGSPLSTEQVLKSANEELKNKGLKFHTFNPAIFLDLSESLLMQLSKRYGPLVMSFPLAHVKRTIILDEIFYDERIGAYVASIRDPIHSWSIDITLDSLVVKFKSIKGVENLSNYEMSFIGPIKMPTDSQLPDYDFIYTQARDDSNKGNVNLIRHVHELNSLSMLPVEASKVVEKIYRVARIFEVNSREQVVEIRSQKVGFVAKMNDILSMLESSQEAYVDEILRIVLEIGDKGRNIRSHLGSRDIVELRSIVISKLREVRARVLKEAVDKLKDLNLTPREEEKLLKLTNRLAQKLKDIKDNVTDKSIYYAELRIFNEFISAITTKKGLNFEIIENPHGASYLTSYEREDLEILNISRDEKLAFVRLVIDVNKDLSGEGEKEERPDYVSINYRDILKLKSYPELEEAQTACKDKIEGIRKWRDLEEKRINELPEREKQVARLKHEKEINVAAAELSLLVENSLKANHIVYTKTEIEEGSGIFEFTISREGDSWLNTFAKRQWGGEKRPDQARRVTLKLDVLNAVKHHTTEGSYMPKSKVINVPIESIIEDGPNVRLSHEKIYAEIEDLESRGGIGAWSGNLRNYLKDLELMRFLSQLGELELVKPVPELSESERLAQDYRYVLKELTSLRLHEVPILPKEDGQNVDEHALIQDALEKLRLIGEEVRKRALLEESDSREALVSNDEFYQNINQILEQAKESYQLAEEMALDGVQRDAHVQVYRSLQLLINELRNIPAAVAPPK